MSDAAIISLFLDRYRAHKQEGATRSLEAYQALFPGYESLIAGEFAKLEELEAAAEDGDAGARIGSFRLLRRLGRGGQAEVYLAEDAKLGRQVALKVIRGLGTHAAEVLARFRREAELTSRLDHPGICPVHEAGTADGVAYIAMKYVRGETVHHHIATLKTPCEGLGSKPRPPDRAEVLDAALVIEKAARILHVTHESGIIHRDVKPGNIMVTESGDPVILDFGLARLEDSDSSGLTRTGDLFGTPAYMSPEQISGHAGHLDRRTDVYSLGVTLFEWLTLERPFEGPTREALYQAITTREPPRLRSLNPAIPPDLAVVVATAIAKERNARYQTALDFAEDLRRVRSHEPILAKPIGPFVRLKRWAQRNPGLAAALGGLIAALATGLVLALFLLGQRDRALLDYDRLGDLSRLQRLQAEADGLWPCTPEKAPAMRAWIDEGTDLAKRLQGHREVLSRLRASGGADDPAAQFKQATIAKLVAELAAFSDPDPARGLLAQMRRRLAFAETVRAESIDRRQAEWADAIRTIGDPGECPKYQGLRLTPQLGLVPIGRDGDSGLFEFAHLETTAPGGLPRRGPDGRLVPADSAGIVFVLLPGGSFRMGASKPDEGRAPSPNADPEAESRESPVTEVSLDPFFMSKYEMTQAQWTRLVGHNPSRYVPGSTFGDHAHVLDAAAVNLRNPVEHVSWDDCDLWMGRLGLLIPTEAQWEYAARGGTSTPRWNSRTLPLSQAANLADAFCKQRGGPVGWGTYESWSDGFAVHAPVGSLAPNPFGLHDVLGNVWEWCRDGLGSYELAPRPHDGLRPSERHGVRVYRGGSFTFGAFQARSAVRYGLASDFRHVNLGIRPARRLDP